MNAISLENLSKCYKIYNSPIARVADLAVPWRKFHRELWALKDVNLEVPAGQALGIIGRNGSGKTTLLKMIMGISRQTTGTVDIQGKVAALLELGAGFHPEFTGRENVLMNCAMMGMNRKEAEARLDEIIDFSEIEDFIDIPVKMYSSGMYVRLGFSVATSVDPDILIVDEALSVGDEDFVNKCQGRFREMLARKTTLLFVSHQLGLVRSLADRVILLSEGRIIADGDPDEVSDLYLERIHKADRERLQSRKKEAVKRHRDGKIRLSNVRLLDGDGREECVFPTGQPIEIRMNYEVLEHIASPHFSVSFCRNDGFLLMQHFQIMTKMYSREWDSLKDLIEGNPDREPGDKGEVRMRIDQMPFMPGNYYIVVYALEAKGTWNVVDEIFRACEFSIPKGIADVSGMVYVPAEWKDIPKNQDSKGE